MGLIPAGAREILIEEVAEAANFLALRGEDPDRYFLNGGWTIQWNGDYQVAGTTFTYVRTGDWENLTSPGPTREPVWIQVPAPGAGRLPGTGGCRGRWGGRVLTAAARPTPAAVPGEQPRGALRVHHPPGGRRPRPGPAARVLLAPRALEQVHGHLWHRWGARAPGQGRRLSLQLAAHSRGHHEPGISPPVNGG